MRHRRVPRLSGFAPTAAVSGLWIAPRCCEPLPQARRSALIAQVGAETVFIGNGLRMTVAAPGPLRLRINDCDEGLFDNRGTLNARVVPVAP